MADILRNGNCGALEESDLSPEGFLYCHLPPHHEGPHYDAADRLVWRVAVSAAIPRITQAYLTPSADLPACRDEDPAHADALAACYPDPPEYPHLEDDEPEPSDFAASMTYEEARYFITMNADPPKPPYGTPERAAWERDHE